MKSVRCSFMIPVAFNDGREIPPETVIEIKRLLDRTFHGYFIRGPLASSWEGQVELMNEYNIVVPKNRVDDLRSLVASILKSLGQLAMYFEVHNTSPEITLFSDLDDRSLDKGAGSPVPEKKKAVRERKKPKRGGPNA